MKRITGIFGALAAALLLPLIAHAAQQGAASADDMSKYIINTPSAASWAAYGANQKSQIVKAPQVTGGGAYRVTVTQGSANVWEVGVQSPISGAIKSGDKILLAFWARVVTPPAGQQTGVISAANIQLAAPPYTAQITAPISIGNTWKMHYVSGTASQDLPAGKGTVQLQVGSAPQVIDLGPVIVMDFGPNYDTSKFPQE